MTTPLFERLRLRQQIEHMIQTQGPDQAWHQIETVIRSVIDTKYPYDAAASAKETDLGKPGGEHSPTPIPG